VSPRFGTVPCIIDFGRRVFESAICVEFVEDRFPDRGTPLMPPGAPLLAPHHVAACSR
jgi:glutathione S-transferase